MSWKNSNRPANYRIAPRRDVVLFQIMRQDCRDGLGGFGTGQVLEE
jgi:hypothetical protein